MGKHNTNKRKEFNKRRKQEQSAKKRKTTHYDPTIGTNPPGHHKLVHNNVTTTCTRNSTKMGIQLCSSVKTGIKQDKDMCQMSESFDIASDSQSENETDNGSGLESNATCRSPFHMSITTSSSNNSKYSKCSKHSVKSFSWERAEATDPLLVRWREYRLLRSRLSKIERHKF